jgi:hypothetical protein
VSSERSHDVRAPQAPAVRREAAEVAAPAPVAPAPLAAAVGTLVVGHAEDRAEADADKMADVALARLRRTEIGGDIPQAPEAHQHGPGCDHLRRSAAPSGGAVVGYEGGALDAGTTSAIESRRGAGRPLDAAVRRRMEGAFGASFAGVRIHADDTAARLNSAVSAKAFTTGKDVFFGQGQFAPGTRAGDKILAHELAHTLQPAGGAARTLDPRAHAAIARTITATGPVLRRGGVKEWVKNKAAKVEAWVGKKGDQFSAAADRAGNWVGAKASAASEAVGEVATAAWDGAGRAATATGKAVGGAATAAWDGAGRAATATGKAVGQAKKAVGDYISPDKDPNRYDGPAGRHDDNAFAKNVGKYTGVAGGVGGIMGGTMGTSTAGGGETVPLLNVADSAMGYVGGRGQVTDSEQYGDLGGVAAGGRRKKNALTGAGQAAVGVGKAVGETVLMKQAGLTNTGEAVAKMGGSAGAGAAAGALGVVVGGLQVMHGGYRLVRAIQKHSKIGSLEMLSTDGQRWQQQMKSVEKVKAVIGGVKIALGVLGIAAGALFLASNPVGWAVGVAAAVAGGVYAATKIGLKLHEMYKVRQAARDLENGAKAEEIDGPVSRPAPEDDLVPVGAAPAPAPVEAAAPAPASAQGDGGRWASPRRPAPPTPAPYPTDGFQAKAAAAKTAAKGKAKDKPTEAQEKNRSELLAKTNAAARQAAPAARLGGELIDALKSGDHQIVEAAMKLAAKYECPVSELLNGHPEEMALHDAYVLLAAIDVTPEVALSDSGLDIISRKLSKIDAL